MSKVMTQMTLFRQTTRVNGLIKRLFRFNKLFEIPVVNPKNSKLICKRITDSFSPQMCRDFSTEHLSAHDSEGIPKDERYIHKTEVERFIMECMMSVGTEEERARMIALNLSEADYVGHFSHGLNRLTVYIKDCQGKFCKPNNDPVVLKNGPVTALVDGNNGLGVVVGTFCMELAIKMAKTHGLGWVVAKGSNHFGICQWYSEMARKQGLIGITCTNTSPWVAPTRSSSTIFGTNPICVAAPGEREDDSFLLDMSTSSVALGKIEIQLRKNEPLPSFGWALGKDGKPTDDSKEAFYEGKGLLPLGGEECNSGYKGYGLGMFVELITGLLSGSAVAHEVRDWRSYDREANLGQCFVAINPEMFSPGITTRLQELMDHLRKLKPTDATKPVLVPGDPERVSRHHVNTIQKGAIFYTSNHISTYRNLAKELNVEPMRRFDLIEK